MTEALRPRGSGLPGCFLPLSLCLKTWGRQRAAGRQGRVKEQAGCVAHIATLTHTDPGPAASRGLAKGHSSVKSLSMSM